MTKYNTNSSYGTVDNKTTLEPEDDAATVILGGSWRMPTKAEWDELNSECTWTWTTLNGVNGYRVSSKTNGNSIFLPAAGSGYGSSSDNVGSCGLYWSSSLVSDYSWSAYVYFDSGGHGVGSSSRCRGRSVRPVTE